MVIQKDWYYRLMAKCGIYSRFRSYLAVLFFVLPNLTFLLRCELDAKLSI